MADIVGIYRDGEQIRITISVKDSQISKHFPVDVSVAEIRTWVDFYEGKLTALDKAVEDLKKELL